MITTLLVGSHFHPPASLILSHLPSDTPLLLDPEPDNPYDKGAIKVWVDLAELSAAAVVEVAAELPNFGSSLEELLAVGTEGSLEAFGKPMLWLGYIAATGGRPLAKARPGLVGNQEVLAMLAGESEVVARLEFGPNGEPEVQVIDGRRGVDVGAPTPGV